MSTICSRLAPSDANAFNYIIVGGGTAGCVIASRLSEYLPDKQILVIEAGPSDFLDKRISNLKCWIDLLGTELDYDYGIVEQTRGNSTLRQSRAKVLGGCSSHNGCISLHTFEDDCRRFQEHGCSGWGFETLSAMIRKTQLKHQIVDPTRQNELVSAWISAASKGFDIPVLENINHELAIHRNVVNGAGYMPISYDVATGDRVSASTSYIHPILRNEWVRPNLKILVNAQVSKINIAGNRATGVTIIQNQQELILSHKTETIVCAGAIDSPRLMLLSGLGPRQQLESLNIPVIKDIPGVGENLQDHVETNMVWELTKPVPPQTVTYSDSFCYYRDNQLKSPPNAPNIMFHLYTIAELPNFEQLGYKPPRYPLVIMPNIPQPRSRGKLYLTSRDPRVQPALDFRYFTDPEGYDEQVIIKGLKLARKLAQTSPLKEWILREVAPGPEVTTDEALSEYGRSMSTTLFHPCGTAKMGDVRKDPLAVVDTEYRVRHLSSLRVVDASVMPVLTTTNPMLTVIAIAEHAAEVIAGHARKQNDWQSSRL